MDGWIEERGGGGHEPSDGDSVAEGDGNNDGNDDIGDNDAVLLPIRNSV